MARGRFISKAISLDEKVDALSDDTCRLLFTWLIPHLDCEGRIYGDAQTIKSIVFPRRSTQVARVEKYLKELENSGLILRYSINGNQYLSMQNFEKHQPGLIKNRESQSQIPPFTQELIMSNVGVGHSEVKVKVKEEVKDKDTSPNPPVSQVSTKQVIEHYEENILLGGRVNEEMDYELSAACARYSQAWVLDAIKESLAQNHATWQYIVGILKNWQRYGKK